MKRSQSVPLLFLGTLGIAIAACGGKGNKEQALHCVNQEKIVVEEKYCPDKGTTGTNGGSNAAIFPYFWWYGGMHGLAPGASVINNGGSISPNPGTTYRSSVGSALTGGGSKSAPSVGGVSRGGFGGSAGSGSGGGS